MDYLDQKETPMQRYIGLDAHATSCTVGVMSEKGKRLDSKVLETSGTALVEHIKRIPGQRRLCLEESTHSGWLYEILSPHVHELVVTRVEKSRGSKDDVGDAFRLADRLRVGDVLPVFKEKGEFSRLRALCDAYGKVNADNTRVQSRLKALYRSRGVRTPAADVFKRKQREQWLMKLPSAYRSAAEVMYLQYDALHEAKKTAKKLLLEESSRHAIAPILQTCPGLGPTRVAQLMSIVVTPYRFRTSRQLWSYSGLAIVMRSSSDWVQTPKGWQRVNLDRTRGLNRNYNRTLKYVFKGAVSTVTLYQQQPLYGDFQRLLEQGTKPPMARLTLARRIAATVLSMWKKKEAYDPDRYRPTR
jgi:transposase